MYQAATHLFPISPSRGANMERREVVCNGWPEWFPMDLALECARLARDYGVRCVRYASNGQWHACAPHVEI